MLIPATVNSQIDYFQDFALETHNWTDLDFYTTDNAVCGADMALRANLVNQAGVTVPAEVLSPPIGVSNGEMVTLSYSYKLLKFDEVLPSVAVNEQDWGWFKLEYGPTRNGPWTQIDAVTPFDHIPSLDCAVRTVRFAPPADTEVYLRVVADAGTSAEVNYFLYLDDFSVFQDTFTTDREGREGFEIYPNPVTDYLYLNYDGIITAVTIFNMQGQEVVVENLDRDFRRLDMSGLEYGNYVLKIFSDNTVKEVEFMKH